MFKRLIKEIKPKNLSELLIRILSVLLILGYLTKREMTLEIGGVMLLIISFILLFIKVEIDL